MIAAWPCFFIALHSNTTAMAGTTSTRSSPSSRSFSVLSPATLDRQAAPEGPRTDRLVPPERLVTEDGARAYRRFLEWSVGAGFKLAVVEVADPRRRAALVAW